MSTRIASIVVPVDFGRASANAVALAGHLAEGCGAAVLRLLHADQFEVPPYFTPEQMGTLDRERAVARAQAHDYLRTFGQTHTARPFTTAVVDGPAVDVILNGTQTADLVVMGTHGRRGISRWWLGSVAERVLRAGATPVIVTHENAAPMPAAPLVLIAASDRPGDVAPRDYGQALATCLRGRWSVAPFTALPDAAVAGGASLVVTASPWPDGDAIHARAAEQLLRSSRQPVLFVPAQRR
jgi:nucleotide-binding universal stress UspA family protein